MAGERQMRFGTYRCPVCGHKDGTEIDVSVESVVIACSYCDTPLELSSRGADSSRFSVLVAEQPAK
jgi:transcription elongation factor Elf1